MICWRTGGAGPDHPELALKTFFVAQFNSKDFYYPNLSIVNTQLPLTRFTRPREPPCALEMSAAEKIKIKSNLTLERLCLGSCLCRSTVDCKDQKSLLDALRHLLFFFSAMSPMVPVIPSPLFHLPLWSPADAYSRTMIHTLPGRTFVPCIPPARQQRLSVEP